jgi:hypothetical protein
MMKLPSPLDDFILPDLEKKNWKKTETLHKGQNLRKAGLF